MCRFCVQHGDGKTWYLEAKNYIADLESDVARRDYMIGFARNFKTTRPAALLVGAILDALPSKVADPLRSQLAERQQKRHFGQPVPIEQCERIFDLATSIVRLPCICRTFAGKPDRAVCLAVTTKPNDSTLSEIVSAFADGPDVAPLERLSKEQALELLRDCEHKGLMHSVWTFESPMIGAICNCNLKSGCLAMRMTAGHRIKTMWRGEDVAVIADELCVGCGACAKQCPFQAFVPPKSKGFPVSLNLVDCWGCGICRAVCPSGAISLQSRIEAPSVSGLW